jgi:hypothetical protein
VRAAYTHNATDQRPRFASPAPINAANLRAHFEDEKYYDAYLAFFDGEVKRLGMNAALEEHVLSVAANVDPEAEKTGEVQPYMLVRFLAAVVHPVRTTSVFHSALANVVAADHPRGIRRRIRHAGDGRRRRVRLRDNHRRLLLTWMQGSRGPPSTPQRTRRSSRPRSSASSPC